MKRLKQQLKMLKEGQEPDKEEIEAAVAALPLLVGADGVMVGFRPHGSKPSGRTVWREVK
ncbi:MAG: ISKra4 family transposase, partial [Anaerolineae bacterium]|nr:ISKra4 family transposase [Anaerolineae bacterium]